MRQTERWYTKVEALTRRFVAMRSVSADVTAENRLAAAIAEELAHDAVEVEAWPTADGRRSVAGYLPGSGDGLVVLLSHYDTVGVEEYAGLGDVTLAFDPDQLAAALEAEPQLSSEVATDLRARDAQGRPEWMFGRGALDMKSGVAANVAVLLGLAEAPKEERPPVLFLSCPDEETDSAGVMAATPQLATFTEQRKLRVAGILNSDYTTDMDERQGARVGFNGSVGKLLVSVLVLGKPTHVGEPFRGFDAAHMAAVIGDAVSLRPELADSYQDAELGEAKVPPPSLLRLEDLKVGYNVQTAHGAAIDINHLTLSAQPSEVLATYQHVIREAMADYAKRFAQRYKSWSGETTATAKVPVLSIAELRERWLERHGNGDGVAWLQRIGELVAIARQENNEPEPRLLTTKLLATLADEAHLGGPAVVLALAPPYYPAVKPKSGAVADAVKNAMTPHLDGHSFAWQPFYPFISDMSFITAPDVSTEVLDAMPVLMPLYGSAFSMPLKAMQQINGPVLNIGPFGRNAHGIYERVHCPWSFETLPELLYRAILGLPRG